MDVRPQANEIIRTWLCSSVVRAHLEEGTLHWAHAAISGWIFDPERKKMSKSKGNVVTPMGLLDEHGSDAVRYWAASGRPGTDTAFDVGQMKIGRRLAIKILNASKFVLGLDPVGDPSAVTEPLDRAMLADLAETVRQSTAALEDYHYTRALELAETFFWSFTDDHVELVKDRAYGGQGEREANSAKAALAIALSVQLRLFAPFLPFVTEEVWSWWQEGSIHRAPWPSSEELQTVAADGDRRTVADVAAVLSLVRKAKSEAKASMRADVTSATVTAPDDVIGRLATVAGDLAAAGRIEDLHLRPGGDVLEVDVTLAPTVSG